MFSSLAIENFKCFGSLRLPLGSLTLLTGYNAGGKSTALQPLLLLAQGARDGLQRGRLSLNGPLVRLGTVGDVLPAGTNESQVKFELTNQTGSALWTLKGRAGQRQVDLASTSYRRSDGQAEASGGSLSREFTNALSGVSYISAVREGTADAFPLPDSDQEGSVNVGVDGRFAAYRYSQLVDEEVPELRRHPNETASSMRKQVDAWFSALFPNAQVNVRHLSEVAAESLQFRLSDIGDWRRPANVGYGLTYAFPIVVSLLAARAGEQTLVIDSPEAHLHPRAQSQMGRMLAKFAAAGVQVVVETHSDHLLNGVRLAIREGVLNSRDLAVHFFTEASLDSHGVVSPAIDRDGNLSDWPVGFFDQAESDLAQLAGLR